MATVFDIGDVIKLSASFTDDEDVAIDSGQVRLKLKSPAGTTTTYTYGTDADLIKASTGNYYLEFAITAAGIWFYRWEGNTTNLAAEEGSFFVRETSF